MFQMQSWCSDDACTCPIERNTERRGHQSRCLYPTTTHRWRPMEDGPAKRVWRPRSTAAEAIAKCIEWTGGLFIPAMQVVNLDTGQVVWRASHQYPQAGDPIENGVERPVNLLDFTWEGA